MKRPIYFCKSWFRAKKRPTEIWSEEQAKTAHEKKQLYTVLVDSVDHPYCFLEIAEKFVGVCFLDEFLREKLTYQFQEFERGKLFLTMATYREFEGDTDGVANGVSYVFDQDGSIQIRREFFNPHRIEAAVSTVDVHSNFSVMPAFGEYEELIRVERD